MVVEKGGGGVEEHGASDPPGRGVGIGVGGVSAEGENGGIRFRRAGGAARALGVGGGRCGG